MKEEKKVECEETGDRVRGKDGSGLLKWVMGEKIVQNYQQHLWINIFSNGRAPSIASFLD